MFKIEKNVPMPNGLRTRGSRYPFPQMEVGDSFFAQGSRGTIASAAHTYGKKHGFRFSSRTEGDGVRVWRVA